MKSFFVSCIGKLFYLGVATFGTFYFGIWYLLKRVRRNPVCLFILLSATFTFGITAIYMLYGGRTDSFLYGRYNEVFVPIFVYLGLCEMTENRFLGRMALLAVGLHGTMAVLLISAMADANPENYQGYFTVGLSYAMKERMPEVSDYVIYPYILGSIAMLLLVLVTGLFIRKKKKMIWYLTLFIGLYGYTAISAGGKYLYDHSVDTAEDMKLTETVKERMQEGDTVLFLLSENDARYVDILQFCLREYQLRVIDEELVGFEGNETVYIMNTDKKSKDEHKADFIFTYRNSIQEEALKKQYANERETYHFKLYFN